MGILSAINVREIDSVKQHELGFKYYDPISRGTYRYMRAGAVALAPGKIVINPDVNSDAIDKTVARTYAVGAKSIVVDVAGTIVLDAYAEGTFTVNDATGEGQTYRVVGNTGVTGAGEITVNLAEPITVALTKDVSEYCLAANDYNGVLISIADQADVVMGVPTVTVTAAYYGWIQTGGVCSVLADEAVAKGLALTTGSSVVGAVEAADAAGEMVIGVALEALVDTEYRRVKLTIDN
jgi:hypothetical protein